MRNIESQSILVVGGATIDQYTRPPLGGSIKETTENVIIEQGSKNPSTEYFLPTVGGNGANVARGLARLGEHSTLYTYLGDKRDGNTISIQTKLKEEGVTLQAEFAEGVSADFSTILLTEHNRIILPIKPERNRDFAPQTSDEKPAYIYLTSIGKPWEKVYRKVTEFAKENNLQLAISPGSRQLTDKANELYTAVDTASMISLDKKESQSLLRKKNTDTSPDKPIDILLAVQDLGPETVSMTDGKDGSYLLTPEGIIYEMKALAIPKEKVVDTTGAGDSYTAGLMDALVRGETAAEMMRQGALNGASVIQVIGAGEGLLTKEQMAEQLREHPDFQPKIIRKPQA
jgi:ribokinase